MIEENISVITNIFNRIDYEQLNESCAGCIFIMNELEIVKDNVHDEFRKVHCEIAELKRGNDELKRGNDELKRIIDGISIKDYSRATIQLLADLMTKLDLKIWKYIHSHGMTTMSKSEFLETLADEDDEVHQTCQEVINKAINAMGIDESSYKTLRRLKSHRNAISHTNITNSNISEAMENLKGRKCFSELENSAKQAILSAPIEGILTNDAKYRK